MADPKKLGPEQERVHPKLRMIRSGSPTVNALRSEHASCLRVVDPKTLQAVPCLRTGVAEPIQAPAIKGKFKKGRSRKPGPEVEVSLFVTLSDDAAGWSGVRDGVFSAATGLLRTTDRPLNDIRDLLRQPGVQFVEPGEPLKAPTPTVTSSDAAPAADRWAFGDEADHRFGRDIMVGVIDVQGFDFAHSDFSDGAGGTRFERIWDQGGGARETPHARSSPVPAHRRGFDYGAEFQKADLDAALRAGATLPVSAQEIERQSQMTEAAHGTHVASILAGNHGICRNAMLAGVLLALTDEETDRRQSLYDSTRLAHAVEYLIKLSIDLGSARIGGPYPLAINISLGTNGHAHDGSSAVSRWLDSALSSRGRAVTVATGNAGQESPRHPGDIGFVMGRVHASGRIPAAGLTRDLQWQVVGNTIADLSENELEIWHPAQDRFSVRVRTPDGQWLPSDSPDGSERWVAPGEFFQNHQLDSGAFVSVYNEVYHHANGENYIALYLSPLLSDEGIVGVPAGPWVIRLRGDEVHDGTYHAWIERDDPRRLGRLGERAAWQFPSFFAEGTYVDESTISSLACGQNVIAVANMDEALGRINVTSSQGPTRDGRQKPDVAAPGTNVLAARGFDPEEQWVRMSGTSMASPYVCGVVGLMLAINPDLTAAQINGILRRTARPLPGTDYAWKSDAGFGEINPEGCLAEAKAIREKTEVPA